VNNINTLFEDENILKGHMIARAESLSKPGDTIYKTHNQRLKEKCETEIHLETQ